MQSTLMPSPEVKGTIILGWVWFEAMEKLRRALWKIAIGLLMDQEWLNLDRYKSVAVEDNWVPWLDKNNPLVRDYMLLLRTLDNKPIYQSTLEKWVNSSLTTLLLLNGYKIKFYPPQYGNIPTIGLMRI